MNQTNLLLNNYKIRNRMGWTEKGMRFLLNSLEKTLKLKIKGDIVEMGCNRGASSVFIKRMQEIYEPQKNFHVYDSFEGIPQLTDQDKSTGTKIRQGHCCRTKDDFKQTFKEEKVKLPYIHEGWFKDISDDEYPSKICFAFLDGDLYSSITDSFEKIGNKITQGGRIVVHDWLNPNLKKGVRKACYEFLEANASFDLILTDENMAVIHRS